MSFFSSLIGLGAASPPQVPAASAPVQDVAADDTVRTHAASRTPSTSHAAQRTSPDTIDLSDEMECDDTAPTSVSSVDTPICTVFVVGEINTGKSSFVNALAGGFVCSSNLKRETLHPTRFSFRRDGVEATVVERTKMLEEVRKENAARRHSGVSKLTEDEIAEIGNATERPLPLRFDMPPFDLIDFPGFNDAAGGQGGNHRDPFLQAVINHISKADILVFIVDAKRPVTSKSELETLQCLEKLVQDESNNGHFVDLLIVANKFDEISKEEFDCKLPQKVFRFSSHRMLFYAVLLHRLELFMPDESTNQTEMERYLKTCNVTMTPALEKAWQHSHKVSHHLLEFSQPASNSLFRSKRSNISTTSSNRAVSNIPECDTYVEVINRLRETCTGIKQLRLQVLSTFIQSKKTLCLELECYNQPIYMGSQPPRRYGEAVSIWPLPWLSAFAPAFAALTNTYSRLKKLGDQTSLDTSVIEILDGLRTSADKINVVIRIAVHLACRQDNLSLLRICVSRLVNNKSQFDAASHAFVFHELFLDGGGFLSKFTLLKLSEQTIACDHSHVFPDARDLSVWMLHILSHSKVYNAPFDSECGVVDVQSDTLRFIALSSPADANQRSGRSTFINNIAHIVVENVEDDVARSILQQMQRLVYLATLPAWQLDLLDRMQQLPLRLLSSVDPHVLVRLRWMLCDPVTNRKEPFLQRLFESELDNNIAQFMASCPSDNSVQLVPRNKRHRA